MVDGVAGKWQGWTNQKMTRGRLLKEKERKGERFTNNPMRLWHVASQFKCDFNLSL